MEKKTINPFCNGGSRILRRPMKESLILSLKKCAFCVVDWRIYTWARLGALGPMLIGYRACCMGLIGLPGRGV